MQTKSNFYGICVLILICIVIIGFIIKNIYQKESYTAPDTSDTTNVDGGCNYRTPMALMCGRHSNSEIEEDAYRFLKPVYASKDILASGTAADITTESDPCCSDVFPCLHDTENTCMAKQPVEGGSMRCPTGTTETTCGTKGPNSFNQYIENFNKNLSSFESDTTTATTHLQQNFCNLKKKYININQLDFNEKQKYQQYLYNYINPCNTLVTTLTTSGNPDTFNFTELNNTCNTNCSPTNDNKCHYTINNIDHQLTDLQTCSSYCLAGDTNIPPNSLCNIVTDITPQQDGTIQNSQLDTTSLPNNISNVCNVKPSDYYSTTPTKALKCSCKIASEGKPSEYKKAIAIATAPTCNANWNPAGSVPNPYYKCPQANTKYCTNVLGDNITYKCEDENLVPI